MAAALRRSLRNVVSGLASGPHLPASRIMPSLGTTTRALARTVVGTNVARLPFLGAARHPPSLPRVLRLLSTDNSNQPQGGDVGKTNPPYGPVVKTNQQQQGGAVSNNIVRGAAHAGSNMEAGGGSDEQLLFCLQLVRGLRSDLVQTYMKLWEENRNNWRDWTDYRADYNKMLYSKLVGFFGVLGSIGVYLYPKVQAPWKKEVILAMELEHKCEITLDLAAEVKDPVAYQEVVEILEKIKQDKPYK